MISRRIPVPSQRRFDLWQASQAFARRLRFGPLKESGGFSATGCWMDMAHRGDNDVPSWLLSRLHSLPLHRPISRSRLAAGPISPASSSFPSPSYAFFQPIATKTSLHSHLLFFRHRLSSAASNCSDQCPAGILLKSANNYPNQSTLITLIRLTCVLLPWNGPSANYLVTGPSLLFLCFPSTTFAFVPSAAIGTLLHTRALVEPHHLDARGLEALSMNSMGELVGVLHAKGGHRAEAEVEIVLIGYSARGTETAMHVAFEMVAVVEGVERGSHIADVLRTAGSRLEYYVTGRNRRLGKAVTSLTAIILCFKL
jgi:hypothetical protein